MLFVAAFQHINNMRSALRNVADGSRRHVTAVLERIRNLAQFQLEQLIVRGALSRLFVIAVIMGLLSVVAGLLVYYWVDSFDDPSASIWWAFLHLTDSGYLGDDEGTLLRIVSTFMTIAGVVLFVGALIAIMTQWLNETIERLAQGFTPIAQNNHVLILGWNNRTAVMVEQLMIAEGRVKRFLRRHGAGKLKIVILAEHVGPELVQELKDRLGPLWNSRQITLRSGSPLRLEHLLRVDYLHAAVILLPSFEFGSGLSAPDERTIKTLMAAAHSGTAVKSEDLPLMVTELFDADQLRAARRAYPGPAEMIGTGLFISRLMAQNSRHRGLSSVYTQLLSEGGNQIYVRDFPEFTGKPLSALAEAFEQAVLLGAVRPQDSKFLPLYADPGYVLGEEDRLALVSESFENCVVSKGFKAGGQPPPLHDFERVQNTQTRRVLLLGWNQKVPELIREFDAYLREPVIIDVISLVPPEDREKQLARRGIVARHAQIQQLEADLTSRFEMTALEPGTYDNIILVASDWLDSAEQADARSLLGYLVLAEVLEDAGAAPPILVEAMSADNAGLFQAPNVELLVSPDLQSHMLTQVALRRELHWVMDELFGASGAEIRFRAVQAQEAENKTLSFRSLQRQLAAEGEIFLGILRHAEKGSDVVLNPKDKNKPLDLRVNDELVVLDVA